MKFEITNNDSTRFSGIVDFTKKRNIHGFYVEYDHKLNEKFSIKPSVRYEMIDKNVSFEKSKEDFWSFWPRHPKMVKHLGK